MNDLRAPSAAWVGPDELAGRPWRVGRSLGRTVYAQVDDKPGKGDVLLGMMETEFLAQHVVDMHNSTRGGT